MPTWTLRKQFRFEASHVLPKHGGKCRRLHGHSWVGWVVLEGNRLQTSGPETGMVVDFDHVEEVLRPIVEAHLDHWHLNESTGLEDPTSEALARWVYERVAEKLPQVVAVIIEETCTAACEYRP